MPKVFKTKKLVLVLAISLLMTDASIEAEKVISLTWVLYIHYSMQFQKNKAIIQALINSSSEVNVMTFAYAKQLGFRIRKTDVGVQKIDNTLLEIFEMIIANFQIEDKFGRAWFFQELFLLADTTMEVILKMPFLNLSNVDI